MPELTYYIGVTLDGFIAGPQDEVDFLGLSEEFVAFLAADFADALPGPARTAFGVADAPPARFDTVVMGRRTYDPALAEGLLDPYPHLRTVVLSTTLPAATDPVEVTAEAPLDVVRRLKADPSSRGVYLAGGGRLAGQVSAEIDRLVVKKYPVVVGDGVRMMDRPFAPEAFALERVRTFDNGCAVLEYARTTLSPRDL
jgi:dihydrofolate reductase